MDVRVSAFFKSKKVLWWLVVMIAACVYAIGISHESIWYDEACSAIMAEHPLSEIYTLTAADNHPPLYYMLLRIVRLVLGNSVWALRSLSAAAAVALVCLGAGPIRRIFGDRAGFIYAIVMLFTPMSLIYAHEARMYTLAILAVTAGVCYGYLAVQNHLKRDWMCFGLSTLAAAYLHYYGLLAAFFTHIFVLGWLLLKKREQIKAYLLTGMAVVIGYLPWLSVLLKQTREVKKGFWLLPPTFIDVLGALFKPFAYKEYFPALQPQMYLALALSLVLVVSGLVLAIKKKSANELTFMSFLLFVYLCTLITTFLFSLAVAPIFYSRYFMICAGLFLLFVSLGINQLPGKYLPLAAVCLFGLSNILTFKNVYTGQFNFFMNELVQDYQDEIKPGDLVITSDSYSMGPAMYYFPQAEHYYTNNSHEVCFEHVLKPFIPPLHYEEGLKELLAERDYFWYITCNTGLSKHIRTVLKGIPGWEPYYLAPVTYSQSYTPITFSIQKFFYTGKIYNQRGTLNLHITGLRPKGSIYVILYKRESSNWKQPLFIAATPYRFEYIKIENKEIMYSFDGLDYGEYVLLLSHDENENHNPDFDRQGMPAEGLFVLNSEKMNIFSGEEDSAFDKLKFTFGEPERLIEAPLQYPPFPQQDDI